MTILNTSYKAAIPLFKCYQPMKMAEYRWNNYDTRANVLGNKIHT